MTSVQLTRLKSFFLQFVAPGFMGRVSDYIEQHLRFNEPDCSGPFSLTSREYLRDMIDCINEPGVTDETIVAGSRAGKTRTIFAQLAWALKFSPSRFLFVMPTTYGAAGAQNISRTRIKPMIRATKCLAELIPEGSERYYFKDLQMMLGGSIIDLTGSNSANNLASNPVRRIYQDELDKFGSVRRRGPDGETIEAHPSALADERCKEFSNPFRFKSGTVTLPSGKLWDTLVKQSDFRRRFIPCPLCGQDHPSSRMIVLAWSKQFTVLPLTGKEAFVRWDAEARRADGTWDMERVKNSARYECPHCGGHIRDSHKAWMDRCGEWVPTQPQFKSHRGFHLPSMYADTVETRVGNMAVKFLNDKRSGEGPQNFINSYLAEPYMHQDQASKRIETVREAHVEITSEWKKLLTVDVQQKWPYLWFVLRAWNGGDSEGLICGHLDNFEELRSLQLEHGLIDEAVIIDSGFGSKKEAEVYRHCAAFTKVVKKGFLQGWMPSKGFPSSKVWYDREKKLSFPYFLRNIDPFMGTTEAGMVKMSLFEFAGMYYEDHLVNLRTKNSAYTWSISKQMDEYKAKNGSTYRRHLDGHKFNEKTMKYERRHRDWPDHLLYCEILQTAVSNFLQWFDMRKPKEEKKQLEAA